MDATVREFIKSTYQSLTGSVKGSLKDAWRIDGLGLLSISILVVLAIYIYINSRCETCGFENPPIAKAVQYTGISDLPEAPQNNLADVNSLPYQDPAMVKGSTEMLRQLKQDMDGFSTFELEKMPDVSDPTVKLPITQFKGDYQRVKDELMVVNRTPGVQPSLTVQTINEMAANLRFLQRTYRTYANNELVPQPQTPMTQVGASETVEGFSTYPVTSNSIDPSTLDVDTSSISTGEILKNQDDFPLVNGLLTPDPYNYCPSNHATIFQSFGGNGPSDIRFNLGCYPSGTTQVSSVFQNDSEGVVILAPKDSEVILMDTTGNIVSTLNNTNTDGSDWGGAGKYPGKIPKLHLPGIKFSSIQFTLPGTSMPTIPPIDPSALYNSYMSWMNSSSYGTTTTVDTVSPSITTGSNVASNVTPVMTDTPTHTGDPNYARITRTQLDLLVQKITVEITRLQASGTTDPIVRSRVNIFLRIKQSLTDIQKALDAGTMKPQDIPILVKDYNNFLPAIGSTNTGIAGLLSQSGYPTLASLFNAFSQGDITNSEINNHLLHSYARALINGLSYKFDISYTSANEVEARKAEAIKAAYDSGDTAADIGMNMKMYTGHPRTMHGSRGAFDSHIRQMDLNGFERDSQGYSRPSSSAQGQGEGSGGFDWKGRAEKIFDNVKRAGMDPYDYGMDPDVYANAINTDFSWRGYTKMVCSRLATNAEQGMAEKMGCPPASWIGWRS